MWLGKTDSRFSQTAPRSAWLGLLVAAGLAGLLYALVVMAPEAPSYY